MFSAGRAAAEVGHHAADLPRLRRSAAHLVDPLRGALLHLVHGGVGVDRVLDRAGASAAPAQTSGST